MRPADAKLKPGPPHPILLRSVGDPSPLSLSPAVLGRGCRVRGYQGTRFGVPASKRAFAGSVWSVPVVGSTHGHGFAPKKAGFALR